MLILALCVFALPESTIADKPEQLWNRYFERLVSEIEQRESTRATPESDRQRLFSQLGLDPLPSRGDLKPQVMGVVERNGVIVERLCFQSLPGLYVTANLYRPKTQQRPLPGLLYLCGHGAVHIDGVSYGNKVHYRHHGEWAAKLGFVCLMIDSLQLGEIEGIHHGTHHLNRWWWVSRGYTPAGVEAWNCLRSIDYLVGRPEVDPERLGCTGRSGGGAYSWWIAAIDTRIRCAVPVAGITDLRDHVIKDCVSGHCDCMYPVNLDRWNFSRIAALVAPRPVLLANTDRDPIFPLSGVIRIHRDLEREYLQCDAPDHLGLAILPGGHIDGPELQLAAFHWLLKHLSDSNESISLPKEVSFSPQDLKVFQTLPSDAINSVVDETFAPRASASIPEEWDEQEDVLKKWSGAIEKVLERHRDDLPQAKLLTTTLEDDGWVLSQFETANPLVVRAGLRKAAPPTNRWRIILTNDLEESIRLIQRHPEKTSENIALLEPRGSGPTSLPQNLDDRIHHHRKLHLLGETLDAGRIDDARAILRFLLNAPTVDTDASDAIASLNQEVTLEGSDANAWLCLAIASVEPQVTRIEATSLTLDRDEFPILMAFDRHLTQQQLLLVAAEACSVVQLSEASAEIEALLSAWAESRNWQNGRLILLPDDSAASPMEPDR